VVFAPPSPLGVAIQNKFRTGLAELNKPLKGLLRAQARALRIVSAVPPSRTGPRRLEARQAASPGVVRRPLHCAAWMGSGEARVGYAVDMGATHSAARLIGAACRSMMTGCESMRFTS
jgi:hypothetical protein